MNMDTVMAGVQFARKWVQAHFWVFFLTLFVMSRAFVITHPPLNYSDVTHYHEKYANAWHYGLPPYLKYPFEYGPVAALLIYAPLPIDLAGVGQYYLNYRVIMLSFDTLLFIALLWTHQKRKLRSLSGLFLYLFLTTIGSDWLYEGIDMSFVSVAMLSGTSLLFFSSSAASSVASWVAYWISTAIKFLTLPLAAPLYLLNRSSFFRSALLAGLMFVAVWGVPLAIFRSSLSVPFVINAQRTIKYNTIADTLIRTVNFFTHTEKRSDQPPDFSWQGPVAQTVQRGVSVVYPLSLLAVLFWSAWLIFSTERPQQRFSIPAMFWQFFSPSGLSPEQKYSLFVQIYFVYFLVSFLTAKIYSNPFLLWVLPMLVVYPWKSVRRQKWYFLITLLWGVMELTPLLSARNVGFVDLFRNSEELYVIIMMGWVKWSLVLATLGMVLADQYAGLSTPTLRQSSEKR